MAELALNNNNSLTHSLTHLNCKGITFPLNINGNIFCDGSLKHLQFVNRRHMQYEVTSMRGTVTYDTCMSCLHCLPYASSNLLYGGYE